VGGDNDPTGLTHLGAREYDHQLGPTAATGRTPRRRGGPVTCIFIQFGTLVPGEGEGRWNLDLGDVVPAIGLETDGETVEIDLARFDTGDTEGGTTIRRGVPIRWIAGHPVTTVFDLLMAQYGVRRDDLPGEWPTGYDDEDSPNTPAWQEKITGVPAGLAARIGREFSRNAERSRGRSMIVLGAGANQWFHSDMTYRATTAPWRVRVAPA
jgi:nitrate reductase alpha subunit